jgi:hypothetical protein
VTTKDAGDAVTLLQSLAGSTFDSSQLVLTARMGYQPVNETVLQELRDKHRPSVMSSMEERAKGLSVWTDTNGLPSKLYNFKREPKPLVSTSDSAEQLSDVGDGEANQENDIGNVDDMYGGVTVTSEIDSLPDPKDQVVFLYPNRIICVSGFQSVAVPFISLAFDQVSKLLYFIPRAMMVVIQQVAWLKLELCRLLEERRSAVLRSVLITQPQSLKTMTTCLTRTTVS